MQETRNWDSIPSSGRYPVGGHGNPLQYSCLETPMDRWDWWATVHRVTKSWTLLKQFRMHTSLLIRHPIPPCPAGLRQRQKDEAGWPAGVRPLYRHSTCQVCTGPFPHQQGIFCHSCFSPHFLLTYHSPKSCFPTHRNSDGEGSFILLSAQKSWPYSQSYPSSTSTCVTESRLYELFLNFRFLTCKVGIMRICLKAFLHRKGEFKVPCLS